ncbi:4-hydroxybenzoate octaprenyltransferase [Pelagibacteraceae bacterium]|nr:4-hydroxybenzoate octaprenyltransferase [Pelagibacteraceae bacterium]
MSHLKIFINLTRLDKPIGVMLLFWPCSWGLAYAYSLEQNLNQFLYYLFLFFLGSVLMRSAGCIVNDIVDKNIDKKVQRTKNRPLASGLISVKLALIYVVALCALAFVVLVQFNLLTICLGFVSMVLAFTYPFMKRITYWPQFFLGLTFNWGIVMAWTAMTHSISSEIIILYIAAIFWTLGYDTIYGAQDIADDEIIGMKSTSIKFKNSIKLFVGVCYLVSTVLISFLFYNQFGLNNFTILITTFILSLIYQIMKFKKTNPKKCLQAFKLNNISGFLLFLGIFLIN